MNRYSQNSLKTGIRVKEFTGWFIAILFPFTAGGLIQLTHLPIISAYIAWIICGVLLRFILSGSIPYFRINIKSSKKEIVMLCITSLMCSLFYASDFKFSFHISYQVILNIIAFSLFYGAFEQLIWINIVNTAGAKNKLIGFAAVIIFEILMYFLCWRMFIVIPSSYAVIFIILYIVANIFGFIVFIKSMDITIWSFLNIIFSVIVVLVNNFSIQKFIFAK